MKTILHTKKQGLRVHKLAALGGLVAIAGLEDIDAPLLLGAFLELAQQLPRLGLQHITQLRQQGLQKLNERKNGKLSNHLPEKAQKPLTEITLPLDHTKQLILKLGGRVPALAKDILPELYRLMRR